MPTIHFPYAGYPPVNIPEKNLIGVYGAENHHASKPPPCAHPVEADAADFGAPDDLTHSVSPAEWEEEKAIIRKALAESVGMPRLADAVRGARRVLIISDDHHRPTPVKRFLPCVIEELAAGGITVEQIDIIMALGSHRLMTDEEMREKLGDEIVDRHRVYNHDWTDPRNLIYVETVEPGIEVWINRKVQEFDFIVGLGRIMPIEVCGFTGGSKIMVPGLCGEKTNSDAHWVRVDIPSDQIHNLRDNPVRAAFDRSAMAAGLNAIVNVIMDDAGHIRHAVAGHPILAHRAGVHFAREVHGVPIPEVPDIVIADAFPFDMEFWQVNKALDAAGMIVRPGGAVIIVSTCYEGLSRTHGEIITRYGYQSRETIKRLVEEGRFTHLVAAVHMIQVADACIDKGVTCYLVTDGIPPETIRKINLEHAATATEALKLAFERLGSDARIAVLHRAAEMLPLIMEKEIESAH